MMKVDGQLVQNVLSWLQVRQFSEQLLQVLVEEEAYLFNGQEGKHWLC